MIMSLWFSLKRSLSITSPQRAAFSELEEAELALLKAQTGLEWATASVQYNKSRVKRLRASVEAFAKQAEVAAGPKVSYLNKITRAQKRNS